jgi:antitoxin component of MazEF toxin-antitoxin module
MDAKVEVQVTQLGDGLAIVIPAEYAYLYGLHVGDTVEISLVQRAQQPDAKEFDRDAFFEEVRKAREKMPMTKPVVAQMRRKARY